MDVLKPGLETMYAHFLPYFMFTSIKWHDPEQNTETTLTT
jgi:hypothetical protein